MNVRNMRDGILKIQDGTNGTPNEITVLYADGDLKWTITRNVQQIMDRGSLGQLKKGNDEPVTGSFTKKYDQVIARSSDANPSVYEAITGSGSAASWASTSNYCGVYTCRLIFEIYDSCRGETEKITFEKCHFGKIDFSEEEEVNKQAFEFMDWENEPTVEWV